MIVSLLYLQDIQGEISFFCKMSLCVRKINGKCVDPLTFEPALDVKVLSSELDPAEIRFNG
jgi:hypothetical protein